MQTFKCSIDKTNPSTASEFRDCVNNFLVCYRATPHLVTDQTPSEQQTATYKARFVTLLPVECSEISRMSKADI